MSYQIRPVRYSDALFEEVLGEAGASDGRFLFRLRDRWIDGSERFERPGELLLGAFAEGGLVGVGGISHDPYEPEDSLARLRHVYVLTKCRRGGIARTLVTMLIEHGRKHFRVLRLHTSNEAAARLYESLGFAAADQGRETHRLKL
jgi:ribosomal protein S18 acetylase RimI-like enzyme